MQFRVVPADDVDASTPPEFLRLPAISPLPPATLTGPLALLRRCRRHSTTPRRSAARHRGRRPERRRRSLDRTAVGGRRHREPGGRRHRDLRSSTTPPATPTRCTSTRRPSKSSTAKTSSSTRRTGRWRSSLDRVIPPSTVGDGSEGHGHRYPGEVTRVRASSTSPGQYVWHCHIVEHEDNEMMRPYRIGPVQPGQPDES